MRRWWRSRSLRVSLTLWYVAAMVIVLGLYATVVFLFVSRNLSDALDDRLRGDFQWAARMAEEQPDGSLTWFQGTTADDDPPWLQVWASNGRLLFRTQMAAVNPVSTSRALADRPDTHVVVVREGAATFRLLSGPSSIVGQPVVIQVARSEALMKREQKELLLMLILGLPLGVGAAGFGGYSLARYALAPIERMTERASSINAARLKRSSARRQPPRRTRTARVRLQRNARAPRGVVRPDRAIHSGRVTSASDPARAPSGAWARSAFVSREMAPAIARSSVACSKKSIGCRTS